MARTRLAKSLESEPIDASISAYKYLENHPEFKPNPFELTQLMRKHGSIIRENESKDRKDNLPSEMPHKNVNIDEVKKSRMLLDAFIGGKITRATFLEGFRKLDDLYPGHGWATQGGILSRWYANDCEGLPLDGHSRRTVSLGLTKEKM
jgi:hypothetical protein